MIYQLMKLDVARKLALFMAGAGFVMANLFRTHDFGIMVPLITLYFLIGSQPPARQACTVFEASLPITARDIFCARVLTLGTIAWFPVFTFAAVVLALDGAAAWRVIGLAAGAAAVFTVVALSPLCVNVGRFSVGDKPRLFRQAMVFLALMFAFVLEFAPVLPFLAGCLVVTAGLLAYAWFRMPASFQIVTTERTAEAQQTLTPAVSQGSKARGIKVWAPLFRHLPFGFYAQFLPMMAVIGFTGVWPLAVAMCAIGFQQIHFHSQWFFTLPVSRHKLFAIWGLPLLVIMAVCPALKIYWGLFLSGAPQFTASGVARIVLVYAAVVLGTSLLSVFLVNFTSWRRIGRTLRKTVPPIYLVTLLVGLGTALMWQLFSHTPHSRELLGASTLAWALRILPHDIVALTGTVIIVLGSLYWIVSKQFCELEILPVQMKDLRTS